MIFTDYEIVDNDIESMYVGIEKLEVRIDKFNPLASKKSVTFKNLADQSLLVVSDIGPWKAKTEAQIPNANFLYQEYLNSLDELTRYSKFPVFRSNLTKASNLHIENNDDRVQLPIEDENNEIEFYGSYLKNQSKIIQPFLKSVAQKWPK